MTGVDDIPRELIALFELQVEQLGIRLERRGGLWVGEASGGAATGSMWICAPMRHCLVLCHDVTPVEDMPLFEGSQGPYACACTMGNDAADCSRDCGLALRYLSPEGCVNCSNEEVATFIERGPRTLSSRLLANRTYRSRSIIMLPDFFEELNRSYPGEYSELFASFGGKWDRSAELAIRHALDAIPTHAPLNPGGGLRVLSTVTSLISSLANNGKEMDHEAETMVSRAKKLISIAVERDGVAPSINDLSRELYISRSRLCEVFKRETGQSVGGYARRLRLERAYSLLLNGDLTIIEVSTLLGYPSPSSFCHSFSTATGVSPQQWRRSMSVTETD